MMGYLEDFEPVLDEAAEPALVPVPAGAVKVLPRWADEDEVQKWRLKFRAREPGEDDLTGNDGNEEGGAVWAELELRPFTRELPLTGLPHGAMHFFKVAVQLPEGWSKWSRIVSCIPPSPELPGKCASVFAVVKDKSTALVRWTRPIDFAAAVSCGHITRYKLLVTWGSQVGEEAELSACSREVLLEDDIDSYEVTDLECIKNYRFQVAAENVTGWGDWSDPSPVLSMPPPVPHPPPPPTLRRATHHSVVIQWQHPVPGDAPIQSFRFRYTTAEDFSSGSIEEVLDVPPNLSQYIVEGLTAGNSYIFQARAINKYGMGIWSDSSIAIRTLEGHKPSKIEELSVPHIYKSFITLQWRPAFENGFEVTSHILRCAHEPSMEGALEVEPTVVRKGDFDTCDLRHLQKRLYCFQVAAFNARGMSEWSDVVTVDLAAPAEPPALKY